MSVTESKADAEAAVVAAQPIALSLLDEGATTA